MTGPSPAVRSAAALLERSVTYLLGNLALVTPTDLTRSTPCEGWDLRILLCHVQDALAALTEAVEAGQVGPAGAVEVGDPIDGVRTGARRAIAAWSSPAVGPPVTIDGMPLSAALVAAAGSIEIAAHGWDVARALGWRRPVPVPLAEEMLDLLPLLLTDDSRGCRYAAAVAIPRDACAGDKLIAYLGRRPPGPVERRYLQSRAALLLTAG